MRTSKTIVRAAIVVYIGTAVKQCPVVMAGFHCFAILMSMMISNELVLGHLQTIPEYTD
jgi:hypothetical protein